ncbi:MAG TPA: 4Fe-4S dicluster domain-containing protein, partial [Afifellaceae bacterium]|nr:4Fe-4S dicluster domain-containing protein [Afifellaceae bacterium]
FGEMLRCIKCGACMNHCPIYHAVGGHAYGVTYVGPMGAVYAPALFGLEQTRHLPNASTFCGRCEAVCPMRIPLPGLMRHWREQEFARHLKPATERWGLRLWAFFAKHPRLYRLFAQLAMGALGRLGAKRGRFAWLPLAGGWIAHRDFPAPQGRTFINQWKRRERRR